MSKTPVGPEKQKNVKPSSEVKPTTNGNTVDEIKCNGTSDKLNQTNDIDEDSIEDILSELDNNHEPEKILGATKNLGDISFLVKWKDTNEADLISDRVARIACPKSVIEYYENHIVWNDSENES